MLRLPLTLNNVIRRERAGLEREDKTIRVCASKVKPSPYTFLETLVALMVI